MPFIGNQPALSYTSFAKQDFSTSATTSYTLDNPVTNANELALFINFVRQEPTTAYSASGTTLTLTSATASSDDMYCVYLGKAVQTVNPPNASVGASQLVDASITSGKLASGVLPTNTPAFSVLLSSNQSISDNTLTKVNFNNEQYDTNNAYDNSSNYRFTVPSSLGGKYNFTTTCALDGTSHNTIHYTILHFYKNGSSIGSVTDNGEQGYQRTHVMNYSVGLTLSPSDYIEVYALIRTFGTTPRVNASSSFMGYKIIE